MKISIIFLICIFLAALRIYIFLLLNKESKSKDVYYIFADYPSFLPVKFFDRKLALKEMQRLATAFPNMRFFCGKLIDKIGNKISY